MFQVEGEVLENREVRRGIYLLKLSSSLIAKEAKPGQFVHIRVSGTYEPLLRRPFSFHWVEGGDFEVLYEVVGKGTQLLSQLKPGETLDLLGPLGNGFELDQVKSPLVVAGGMGIAPILFLTEKLSERRPLALIGAATGERVLCQERMVSLGAKVEITTEDGSLGVKGIVTDLLNTNLMTDHSVFACGPTDMLRKVTEICHERRNPCQVCLEERMACGVGACLGCGVRSKEGGYKMVCSDGPVFHASEVIL